MPNSASCRATVSWPLAWSPMFGEPSAPWVSQRGMRLSQRNLSHWGLWHEHFRGWDDLKNSDL